MLTVLDLFSGIGGFSLGLERTGGFKTIAFCEIDSYRRGVLGRHWPDVQTFRDVRSLGRKQITGTVDVIAGGFPCQDLSFIGRGAGLAGKRSGLWSEFLRIIEEFSPAWVSLKTSQPFAVAGWDAFSGSSLRSGTMRSGIVYPRPTLAPLISVTEFGLLPTLRKSDGEKSSSMSIARQKSGRKIDSIPDALRTLYASGSINPAFAEWIMGFPSGWTALPALEIPSSPKSRNSSAEQSSKQKG